LGDLAFAADGSLLLLLVDKVVDDGLSPHSCSALLSVVMVTKVSPVGCSVDAILIICGTILLLRPKFSEFPLLEACLSETLQSW
jgi:hypothetical protein